MLRLRRWVLSHIHRLLTPSAPPVSPNPASPGLPPSSSTNPSRRRSPSETDAIRAFLACLGLSSADVASVVARDPKLLRQRGVTRALAPIFVELTGLGLSRHEIGRLLFLAPDRFRSRSVVSDLRYYQPLLGSSGNLLRALERGSYLAGVFPAEVVNPNVAFLRECGLGACDIARICLPAPRMLTAQPERVRAMVACAEQAGVSRRSRMFVQTLKAVKFLNEEQIAARVAFLKKKFRWTDAEVRLAVAATPSVLTRSEDALQLKSDLLISEAGLEPAYVAHRPALLCYRMKGWLRPRYYVVKFLKAKGLMDQDQDFYDIVKVSKEKFVKKFICPHMEAAPHLAEDYAVACKGEVPTNFRFT